jgi:hypothetical protein
MTIGDFILEVFIDAGHKVTAERKGLQMVYSVRVGVRTGVTKYVTAYRFRLAGSGWVVGTYKKNKGGRWEQVGAVEPIEKFKLAYNG